MEISLGYRIMDLRRKQRGGDGMQTREMWNRNKWRVVGSAAALTALGVTGFALADSEGDSLPAEGINLEDLQTLDTFDSPDVVTVDPGGGLSDLDSPAGVAGTDSPDSPDSPDDSPAGVAGTDSPDSPDSPDDSPAGVAGTDSPDSPDSPDDSPDSPDDDDSSS